VSATNDHGLFQHHAPYGPPRFEAVGYEWSDRYLPEANVAAAHWLWEREGWKPWACASTPTDDYDPRAFNDVLETRPADVGTR
jgi:hypothetical protein